MLNKIWYFTSNHYDWLDEKKKKWFRAFYIYKVRYLFQKKKIN